MFPEPLCFGVKDAILRIGKKTKNKTQTKTTIKVKLIDMKDESCFPAIVAEWNIQPGLFSEYTCVRISVQIRPILL